MFVLEGDDGIEEGFELLFEVLLVLQFELNLILINLQQNEIFSFEKHVH